MLRRFVVAMGKSWKLQIVGTNAFFRRAARRQMLVDIILKGLYKVTIMKLIAIQDLKRPRRLKERLLAEKELLLTSDGRPVAVLVNVDASEDPETMIQSIRDSRSRLALSRVRESAARSGTARLSLAEINREIAATRKARRVARK